MCPRHYRRFRLYGDPEAASRRGLEEGLAHQQHCAFEGCDFTGKVTRGYCPTHYMRVLRHGDVSVVLQAGNPGRERIKHPLYGAWSGMINRCCNPQNSSFARYGGRGIKVCDRWRSDFLHYLEDMGERPDGMTLDRIDPDGDYEPNNCRWADAKTQRENQSRNGTGAHRPSVGKGRKERPLLSGTDHGLLAEGSNTTQNRLVQKKRGSI